MGASTWATMWRTCGIKTRSSLSTTNRSRPCRVASGRPPGLTIRIYWCTLGREHDSIQRGAAWCCMAGILSGKIMYVIFCAMMLRLAQQNRSTFSDLVRDLCIPRPPPPVCKCLELSLVDRNFVLWCIRNLLFEALHRIPWSATGRLILEVVQQPHQFLKHAFVQRPFRLSTLPQLLIVVVQALPMRSERV